MIFSEIENILAKKEIFAKELSKLESHLKSFIYNDYVSILTSKFIICKGKRIRSILYFYFLNLNKTIDANDDLIYKTSVLIEIIHFASIIHDDIIDNNFHRRNEDSFFKKYGKKQSIIIGDYLLIKAFNDFYKIHKDKIIRKYFVKECMSTARGAFLEQRLSINSSFKDYIKVAFLKTGSLFKLVCFLGSYISSNDFKASKKAAIYGICFGIIFQIQNDIDCYKFDKYEDSEDYLQKNITFPIIIIRDYMNYNINDFELTSQEKYNEIKNLVYSKEFQKIALEKLSKYKNILENL